MRWEPPQEIFPSIGTVENPAIFHDGSYNLLLCYEVAPLDGGGNAILAFREVSYLEQNTNNVPEGLGSSRHPVRAWEFTEIFDSERTERWSALRKRLWTILFNDVMIEVVFSEVQQVYASKDATPPHVALLNYFRTTYRFTHAS